MLPGITFIIVMMVGILLGVGLGFAILWSFWLLLRYTVWKNALPPDEPVEIPDRSAMPVDTERKSTAG
ncbi:MAG: hypothetical protein JNM56_16785 [Planctomycetia bacterium]|nr:hypothetical protein [Planctomycetia bacterium]